MLRPLKHLLEGFHFFQINNSLIEKKDLKNKKIYAAGLDVFNNEPNLDKRYLDLENCFVLPHIGSATHDTREAMSMMAADNIECFFECTLPISLEKEWSVFFFTDNYETIAT